jgi:hypothetical protein
VARVARRGLERTLAVAVREARATAAREAARLDSWVPLVARAQPAPVPACQVSSLKAHSDVYLSISVGRYASKQLNLS